MFRRRAYAAVASMIVLALPAVAINLTADPEASKQQARVHARALNEALVRFFDDHHAQSDLPAETVDEVNRILGDAAKWAAHTQHLGRPRPEDWPDRKDSLPAAKKLLDAGFEDPLLLGVTGALHRDGIGPRMQRAMHGARSMRAAGYPPEAVLIVADLGLLVNWAEDGTWARTPSLNQFRDELYRDLAAWCRSPGSITPDLENWWSNLVLRLRDEANLEQVEAAYRAFAEDASDQDEKAWLRHLARGVLSLEAAWEHRGSGWSSTVTDEGWSGFEASLERAAVDLKAAYQARPDLPQAATAMIRVSMGQGTGDEQLWFDRAVAADPFDAEPWDGYAWALRPRWGGSYEAVLDLGLRAAAEGPEHSQVPAVLTDAIKDILNDDGQDWLVEHRYRWLPPLMRQLERSDATGASKQKVGTLAFAVAMKSEDFDKALRLYELLETDPEREGGGWGVGRVLDFEIDKRWDVGIAAIRSNPASAEAMDAAVAEWESEPEDAAVMLREAAATDDDPLRKRSLNDLAHTLEQQAAYDRGESVDLLANGLSGWRISRGKFEELPGGGIKAHRIPKEGSRMLSTLRLGEHYEVALDLTPPAIWGGPTLFAVTGLQFGVSESGSTRAQSGVYYESNGLLELRNRNDEGKSEWIGLEAVKHQQAGGRESARIVVRRFGETADIYQNGVPAQRDWTFTERRPGGPLALAIYWNSRGKYGVHDPVHYHRLKVRKLDPSAVSKRAEEDTESVLHTLNPLDPVIDSPGQEPRWTAVPSPDGPLPTDPTPVADPPIARDEVHALFAEGWKDSLAQTAHAEAEWADAGRQIIEREAIRMAVASEPGRTRPDGYLHRDEEKPEAQRILDIGGRDDLLVRAICRANLENNPINRSVPYNEPTYLQLRDAGHTELTGLLLRKRAWLHDPDYRPWAWVKRGENNAMWAEREAAGRALTDRADWLLNNPHNAAPLARLVSPRDLEHHERHANHWRRVSVPAIQAGGPAEWCARSLRLVYDAMAARTLIDAWYDTAPADRNGLALERALDLLSRAEVEALTAWPLASEPAMRAYLAGAIAEAAMDTARAVTGLGRADDAHRFAQASRDWFLVSLAATPQDARLIHQRFDTLKDLHEAGGVLAGMPLPDPDDLEAWGKTYRQIWDAQFTLSQMPTAQRLGALQPAIADWRFVPASKWSDAERREHVIASSHTWLREHGDSVLNDVLAYARRLKTYPRHDDPTHQRYGQAVSLARWLGKTGLAAEILEEAGGPEAIGDTGSYGLRPGPVPAALQASYDAGDIIDLTTPANDIWQNLTGRLNRIEQDGKLTFEVPGGVVHDHWVYCPLELGDQYRISYTMTDPGGWRHTAVASSSIGVAFNTGPDLVLPFFSELPYLGLANNQSVIRSMSRPEMTWGYRWGSGYSLDLLEKANLQGPTYRVVIENRKGSLSLRVNGILARESEPLPGGQPGGGFAIGLKKHYGIEVPAVRFGDITVQKITPRQMAEPIQEPEDREPVPAPKRKRPPRAPH